MRRLDCMSFSQANMCVRKLSILHPQDNLPLILSLSDYAEMRDNPSTENSHTFEFQNHMSTFLSYLTFWQDVLEHCRSTDVRLTLIDHFQALFLQQLLLVISGPC
jgi:hypothetical protein